MSVDIDQRVVCRGGSVFDAYADRYDEVLNASLSASGETKEYFAQRRMKCLAETIRKRGADIAAALDFGCGTGGSIPLFFELLKCRTVVGVDVSERSLEIAARTQARWPARYEPLDQHQPAGDMDLVYTNGTFHHIEPAARPAALAHIRASLRDGGLLAFWENNPWNPGTRYCMAVNPFDRGTEAISPRSARRLLSAAGFQVIEARYLFFFPRALSLLRAIEPCLSRVPLGGQFLLLARKRPHETDNDQTPQPDGSSGWKD